MNNIRSKILNVEQAKEGRDYLSNILKQLQATRKLTVPG